MVEYIDKFLARLSIAELRLSEKKIKKLLSRGRGRPEGALSKNPATRQSRLAAQYVRRIRDHYMKERGLKRAPAVVIDNAIAQAIRKYPAAKASIIREHVRKSSKYRERL